MSAACYVFWVAGKICFNIFVFAVEAKGVNMNNLLILLFY